MIETAALCLTLGPLAIYLLVIGAINLRTGPFVTTGVRDLSALGIAVSGLMLIGPIRLLLPNDFIAGWAQWLLVAAMYFSALSLLVLFSRPRLVIYNVSAAQLQGALIQAAQRLDDAAYWSGDVLSLPKREVHLRIAPFSLFRNYSLVASDHPQEFKNWRVLEGELRSALEATTGMRNPRGYSLVLVGVCVLAMLAIRWFADAPSATREFLEVLGIR